MLSYSPIVLLFSFIFGAVFGSFLNVCIYRLPREISIISPTSHCTSCSSPISFYHNIPIISYLLLWGRCSSCGSSISLTYLIVEILSGLLTVIVVWSFGLSLNTIFYLYFLYSLIIVTFIDLKHLLIPNVITIPGILVGILYGVINTDWNNFVNPLRELSFGLRNIISLINDIPILDSMFGMIFGGAFLLIIALLYKLTRKREGMGMGDVKLLAMIGAFLGWKSVIYVSLISSLFGTIVGIAIVLYKKDDLKYAIPFGPFLSIGAAFYLLAVGFNLKLL